jgi:serine protease
MKPRSAPLQICSIVLALWPATMIAPALAQQNPPQMRLPATNRVVIKFREGLKISLKDGVLVDTATGQADEVQNVLRQLGITATVRRSFSSLSEAQADALHEAAEKNAGHPVANLNLYFVLTLPPNVNAAEVANKLKALPNIESAEPGPTPHLPPAAPGAPPATR